MEPSQEDMCVLDNLINNCAFDEALILASQYQWDQMQNDFWCEIFYGGTRPQVAFWIRFPGYCPEIGNLVNISADKEDLFDFVLKRPDLKLDNIISALEHVSEDEDPIIRARFDKILNDPRVPASQREEAKEIFGL